MTGQRFGVGIVGVEPGRSWAARSHIPALRALPETFDIIGVANTSKASAEAAAAATGLPRAFADVAELVATPEVDIVAVAVKVPPHFEIVKAAISAGKHVYCEWPLGNGLAEAEEMAAFARANGVLGVAGTQARVAPEIRKGVAWAPSLWWGRYAVDGRTVNETTSQRETDMGRGPVFYDNLVEVEAVAAFPSDATGIATSTSASTPIAARR